MVIVIARVQAFVVQSVEPCYYAIGSRDASDHRGFPKPAQSRPKAVSVNARNATKDDKLKWIIVSTPTLVHASGESFP